MTTLFNTCVDIIEKVIKQQNITAASLPIIVTLTDSTDTNITSTLFGVSSLALDASYWTITNNVCNNHKDINFGAAISNYALPLKIKLTTSDGIVLATSSLDTTIETGNELVIYAGSVTLTLNFGTTKLSNAILNLIFKGSNTFPSTLTATYYDKNTILQATIALTANKWSKRGIGTLGEIFFEYGDTQILPTIDAVVNLTRIIDSNNNIWFECPISLPTNLQPNSIIYSNSLILRVPDPEIDLTTYTAPSNSSSVFYVDFNGGIAEKSSNSPISTSVGIEYNSELKLFGTECLTCDSTTNIQYGNVVFPNQFTFQCFIYFVTATTGRTITLAEKSGVFALKKTAANNLEVSLNGSVIISTGWTPSINTWNHIWVQKSATDLALRVNFLDINTTASYTTSIAANNNLFSVCGNILGLCNGIYLENGLSTFTPFTQPLPKRKYSFDDISFWEWVNLEFPQLKLYFA